MPLHTTIARACPPILQRTSDDFFARLDELPQVAGVFCVAYRRSNLGELINRRLNLLVEQSAVGNHDDGIKYILAIFPRTDQLMGEPGDGIRFATARRTGFSVSSCNSSATLGCVAFKNLERWPRSTQ